MVAVNPEHYSMVKNYEKRIAELERDNQRLLELLQRWFKDCNNPASDDYSLWDDTEAALTQEVDDEQP